VTLSPADAPVAPLGGGGDDDAMNLADSPSATTETSRTSLPPDPAAYDSERSAAARARGLAAPYIPGGRDPDQAQAESDDRRDLRLLLIMVVIIVLAGFVLGFLAALTGMTGLVGNPG
jgi:hypothetical protein